MNNDTSNFTEHSSPLFKDLNVIKLSDISTLQLAVFKYKGISSITNFCLQLLIPSLILSGAYIGITLGCPRRLFMLSQKPEQLCGIFNMWLQGAKVWNDISDDICKLLSLKRLKKKLKSILIDKN